MTKVGAGDAGGVTSGFMLNPLAHGAVMLTGAICDIGQAHCFGQQHSQIRGQRIMPDDFIAFCDDTRRFGVQ